MSNSPKLLKARQFHSRVFAVLLVGVILVITPRIPVDSMCRQLMLLAGYILVIVGSFGRAYCSAYIGGRKNDVVVRQGPFSIVRNPLYVFSFLATLGIALQSGMWTLVLVLVGTYLVYYPFVVKKEEAFLANKFGEDYQRYLQEVPRWVPNFKLWNEPEQVDAKPKFIRRTLMDAAVFFLPLPCFVVIQALQSAQILPVWLILP